MRKIRFKAWDCQEKCMVDLDEFDLQALAENVWLQKKFEFMEYTGLYDRNKNEVCECDIVFDVKSKMYLEVVWDAKRAMFGYRSKKWSEHKIHFLYLNVADAEIKGNIYENPELLER